MSQVYDPEGFGRALKGFAEGDETPYGHISKAMGHMKAAELHPVAFGIINIPLVSAEYNQSQDFLTGNLEKGAVNMRAVLTGLNRVAANNRGAEQANLLQPDGFEIPDVEVTDSNIDNWLEGIALYQWKIGLLAMLTKTTSAAASRLAITAGVAAGLWLLFLPDDEALQMAHSRWKLAADELEKFDDNLVNEVTAINNTWEGPAAQTFNTYIENFKNEVAECLDAIRTGHESISSTHENLNLQQHTAFATAIANLVALAIMEILSWTPPWNRGPMKVAMEVLGAVFSVTTGSLIGYIVATIKGGVTTINTLAEATFVTEKEGDGDDKASNGVDFEEVALSEEDINTLVGDAQ